MHPDNARAKEIFLQTVENEIDKVGESAEPSYHKSYTPLRSLVLLKTVASNGQTVIEDFDYQITRIELKPVRIRDPQDALQPPPSDHTHDCDDHSHEDAFYATQMKLVRDRQGRRCYKSDDFIEDVNLERYHDAFHKYVAETTEHSYDPLELVPKLIENGEVQILTFQGVDYVRCELYKDQSTYDHIERYIHVPPKASVDQCPEELVIYPPDGCGEPTTYIRGDVLYYDEQNMQQDLRLVPPFRMQ